MKNIVFVFNCHGGVMKKQLNNCNYIKNNYDIHTIQIYHYIPQRYDKEEFPSDVINLLHNADVLIIQQLRSDRGWLNTKNTIKLVNEKCKVIKIPHYTFSGYWYPYDLLNDTNFEPNDAYVNNLFLNEKDKVKEHLENELNHIKELDELSDIKMYDFVKNNYKKERLFFSRRYPMSAFFYPMCKEILKILNIKDIMKPTFSGYANNHNYPILPSIYDILELTFHPHMNNRRGIDFPCNIVEYFVLAKELKDYPFRMGGYAKKRLKLILNSKKYR